MKHFIGSEKDGKEENIKDFLIQYSGDAYRYARRHGAKKAVLKAFAFLFSCGRDFIVERKDKVRTTGVVRLDSLEVKGLNKTHGVHYGATPYDVVDRVFGYLDSYLLSGTFVDFGCGKGRVVLMALRRGFRHVIGVEFAGALCSVAKENLENSGIGPARYSIVHADASRFDVPDDATVLYFYNPFNDVVLSEVIERINASWSLSPRDLMIIYVNPVYGRLFETSGFRLSHSLEGAGMFIHLYARDKR